jgi:hypothetical protein
MSSVANKFYRVVDAYGIEQAALEGQMWYPTALDHCKSVARDYGVSPQRVAAVLAVTSPRARWSKNMEATYSIVADSFVPAYMRQSSYGILGTNARKAGQVMTDRYYSKLVTGEKVSNFYLNILGHTQPVTVDSIMSYAAGYGNDVSKKIRSEVTEACHSLADVFGMTPRDTQAAVWIAYRGGAA